MTTYHFNDRDEIVRFFMAKSTENYDKAGDEPLRSKKRTELCAYGYVYREIALMLEKSNITVIPTRKSEF